MQYYKSRYTYNQELSKINSFVRTGETLHRYTQGCCDKTPPSCCFKKNGILIYAWLMFELQFALEPCIWNIAHTSL